MTALTLPTDPAPVSIIPRMVSARNRMEPAFGGPVIQRVRKGSKYAVDVILPPMTYAESLAWDDLWEEIDTVVLALPEPGLPVVDWGTPRVKGAGQSGSGLVIDGLEAGVTVPKGKWVTVVTSSQRFLYRTRAAVTASEGGEATLPLRTLLRRPPGDNDVVELAAPKIEGFLDVDAQAFAISLEADVAFRFSIEERE